MTTGNPGQIKNPETTAFSKLKSLNGAPEDQVAEFFYHPFHLDIVAWEPDNQSEGDRFMKNQESRSPGKVPFPWLSTTPLGRPSRNVWSSPKSQ